MKLFLVLLLVLCVQGASAQNMLGFKVFGSLTSATAQSKAYKPAGPRLGYGAEVNIQHTFIGGFFGSVGLNYNQRGMYYRTNILDANNNVTSTRKENYNLDYISLPFSTGFRTGGVKASGKIIYFGRLGLNPSLLLKSDLHQSPRDITPQSDPLIYHMKKFDMGALAELGAVIPIGTDKVTLSLAWQQSFRSFNSQQSLMSHGAWLAVGYQLAIGR